MVDNKRTIRVGSFDYELSFKDFEYGADSRGHADFQSMTVAVDGRIPPQQRIEVLIHEVIHIIFEQLKIKDHDEKFIEVISPMLSRFILDNWGTLTLLKKEVHNDIN